MQDNIIATVVRTQEMNQNIVPLDSSSGEEMDGRSLGNNREVAWSRDERTLKAEI